jgi:hypothetical protein
MRTLHHPLALDPRRFGRRAIPMPLAAPRPIVPSDDLRLFAVTFAAGFLFVSVLIA